MEPDWVLELPNDLRAIAGAVQAVVGRCRELGFDERRLRLNLRVGLTEALSNAMLYGNGRDPAKRVRVEVRFREEAVTVRVSDEGRGFDPELLEDPVAPENRARPGGRGIYLIRRLMDRVEFNSEGNAVTMVLYATAAGRGADGSGE